MPRPCKYYRYLDKCLYGHLGRGHRQYIARQLGYSESHISNCFNRKEKARWSTDDEHKLIEILGLEEDSIPKLFPKDGIDMENCEDEEMDIDPAEAIEFVRMLGRITKQTG